MAAPLTNHQKAYLAQLATRAADKLAAVHPDSDAGRTLQLERFRHEQVAKACGKLGLRCCDQNDYGAVKAHFLNLLGEPGQALRADMRGKPEANEMRIAAWKIRQECEGLGAKPGYAEGICRRMNRGKGLREVQDAAGLWKVYYALVKEGRKRAA